MQTPSRPSNRPSSGQSRSTTRRTITTMTDSILRACSASGEGWDVPCGGGASLGIVFHPRRPPSARSIMQRQSRAFHVALLGEDGTEGTVSTASGGSNFFEHVVKPFMLLKGSSDAERCELLLTWALDMAHHCGLAMPLDAARLFVQRVEGQQQQMGRQSVNKAATMVSPSETMLSVASAADDGQHIAFALPASLSPRRISSTERAAFLHFATRESNVNGVVMATATIPAQATADWASHGVRENSNASFHTKDDDVGHRHSAASGTSMRALLSPAHCVTVLLRVLLHCSSSVARNMSDFDFRKRNRSDRYFSLVQGSDLDSTDEDNDDGAPRPLDTVVLTAAEVILANFNRLDLHESSGAVRRDALTDPAVGAVLEELTRLVQRLSMDGHAERSFGIMLGLVMQILHVVDAHRGALGDNLVPLRRYVEEQAAFYTMKADGATCNRELVDMYERLTEPFYKVVRTLRLLDEAVDALQNTEDRQSDVPRLAPSSQPTTTTTDSVTPPANECLHVLHQCLERFIYFRSAERSYDRAWTHVFHLEMTARERLIEFERERFFAFLWYVKKCVPPHGIHEFISGAKLYRLKELEGVGREAILQEEARKHAFLCRILEARCIMPLETDPKRVANHLVPTTRPPTVASVYDYGHHVSRTPSRPLMLRGGSPIRPGSSARPQSGGRSRVSATPSMGATPQPTGTSTASASSAKAAFFQAARQRDPTAEVRHAESFSRLSLRQAEGDRWFVIVLEHQLRVDEMAAKSISLRPGSTDHKDASMTMQSIFAASSRDAEISAACVAMGEQMRKLSGQETAMRNDIVVEEALEADVVVGGAYYDTIVAPLEREANQRRSTETFLTLVYSLSAAEQSERDAVEASECEAYDALSAIYRDAAHQMGVVYELALLTAAEDVARRRLYFTEESSLDMLQSMYRLQAQLNRDLFRRSLSEAELKMKLEAIARRRAEDDARMMLLEELANMKTDVLRLESVFRTDLEHDVTAAYRHLALADRQSLLSIEERGSRRRVELLESIRNFENVSRFLTEGISQLSHEIDGMDEDLDALSSGTSRPQGDATSSDATNERAADDQLAGILRAGQRAEVHLRQQEAQILKGAFRYHLFLLDAQRPNDAVREPPRAQERLEGADGLMSVDGLTEGHSRAAAQLPEGVAEGTVDTSETSCGIVPLPHVQHIRTRTFLRPVSAAVAAAAHTNDHRRAAAIAKASREFSIAEKMTTFNRIWLSDTSRDQVRAAAVATSSLQSKEDGSEGH